MYHKHSLEQACQTQTGSKNVFTVHCFAFLQHLIQLLHELTLLNYNNNLNIYGQALTLVATTFC